MLTIELLDRLHSTRDVVERARLRDDVVLANRRVADAVANRYRDRGVPVDDLRQAAYEGLVKAVARFDPGHGKDLLSFAVPTITGEIRRYFRDRAWMVQVPRRVQELQWRTNVEINRLEHELGREPTHAEVRDAVGLTQDEYAGVVQGFGCFHPPSLDQLVGGPDGGDSTLGDLVADTHDAHDAAEARCILGPAVRTLAPRDREVLQMRYFEGWTQTEMARELGITQTQVSRRLSRILRTLRRALGADVEVAAGLV